MQNIFNRLTYFGFTVLQKDVDVSGDKLACTAFCSRCFKEIREGLKIRVNKRRDPA